MHGPDLADLPAATRIIITLRRTNRPWHCTDLAEHVGIPDQTVYTALRRLKKAGYISCERRPSERASWMITELGKNHAERIRYLINHLFKGDVPE